MNTPSEALAFSFFTIKRWLKQATNAVKSSIIFRRNFFAAVVWLKSENVAGTAEASSFIKSKEGIAVDPLLARAGWNLAILSVSSRRP
ncbi:hypothetical protein [Shewanella saliphila]|uniref:hypothetical protein n=1 Tax=Shewanella saliphila TaxID=2282698 RepID=UPI00166A6C22|nr:hypothetical protein [Shewanella saliphila]MCL1102502.1 hypothetical protein [Shewanella saliphila]